MTKLTLSLIVNIVWLLSTIVCFAQDNGNDFTADDAKILEELRKLDGRSENLFSVLKDWNSFPHWVIEQQNLRLDWLKTLHENVTRQAWPDELKNAVAGTIEGRSERLAYSTRGNHRVIAIFDSTPVYLAQLVEIINHPLVLPGSSDPQAPMIFDSNRETEAVQLLTQVLGMLRETSYLDGPEELWRPVVVLGTRFFYYHELGHLLLELDSNPAWRFDLYPIEQDYSEELFADRFAFSMLVLETRSKPEIQDVAMAGMTFAMVLIALQEFIDDETFGSIKGAVLRMGRIHHWAQRAIYNQDLSQDSLTLSDYYWRLFKEMLKKIDSVTSPVHSLLRQTANRPESDWELARNQFVKWCVFGDCLKVAATFNQICKDTKDQLSIIQAKKTLRVVNYILNETRPLEQSLEFFGHLKGGYCNSEQL